MVKCFTQSIIPIEYAEEIEEKCWKRKKWQASRNRLKHQAKISINVFVNRNNLFECVCMCIRLCARNTAVAELTANIHVNMNVVHVYFQWEKKATEMIIHCETEQKWFDFPLAACRHPSMCADIWLYARGVFMWICTRVHHPYRRTYCIHMHMDNHDLRVCAFSFLYISNGVWFYNTVFADVPFRLLFIVTFSWYGLMYFNERVCEQCASIPSMYLYVMAGLSHFISAKIADAAVAIVAVTVAVVS